MDENKKSKKFDMKPILDLFKSKENVYLAVISSPTGLRTRVDPQLMLIPLAQKKQVKALLEGVIEELK